MIKKTSNVFWCKDCLVMSTRPRITFDKEGVCSACQWFKKKKKINWKNRQIFLKKLLKKNKKKNFDCIVPVSGGKDGSYVAYNLKFKYGMNPLCVTIRPPLETSLGLKNLVSFLNVGFDHVHITPNEEAMRVLNKIGLTEMGFPYYGWLVAIYSAVIKVAINFNINLIFYAEDGEVEYGGDAKLAYNPIYSADYIISNYLESGYKKVLKKSFLDSKLLYWFLLPSVKEIREKKISITHWSFFEDWDPYRNYIFAKKHCGLEEANEANEGSYTNFAQTDQKLYPLHTYFMYLKYGFGRANQDASIDIRRGSLTRAQGIELVNRYDNCYPEKLIDEYCKYYQMSNKEFLDNIDKWVNKSLFEKKNIWTPKFVVK